MNSKVGTRDIQLKALEILKEFQKICKKHDLLYYAIGGTCIGAIRHGGFIPWDDDIDVAMPYDDYCRFMEVCKSELKKPYSIIGPHNCVHYTMIYSKLQDESTCFVEQTVKKYKDRYCGVYIDIFPIFGLPKSDNKRKQLVNKNERIKRLNIRRRFPISDETNIKGRLYWLLNCPQKLFLKFDYYTKEQENLFAVYKFNYSEKVIFPWRMKPGKDKRGCYKDIFYYEDFKCALQVKFEDGLINVPIGYKRYLTMDFGDYMKLPPKEKQVVMHPSAIIDLNKSFKEYLK